MAKIHKDVRLRARKAMPIEGVITYGAPVSGRFEGTLPAGEILRLDYEPADSVDGVWLVPEGYAELEQLFIPTQVQTQKGYSGYAVYCPCDKIGPCIELASRAA
jgi:hypothetical protein